MREEDEITKCPSCGEQTLHVFARTAPTCVWHCLTCEYEEERPTREVDIAEVQRQLYPSPEDDVHRVYHAFRDAFQDDDGNWRWLGYELIERVEEWARAYPDDVSLVGCDDAHHSMSLLVLVQHKRKSDGDFMGTSVIFIAQEADDKPTTFFLYPEHQEPLVRALAAIKERNLRWWDQAL